MLTSGDVLDLDLGPPVAREAGFFRPAVLMTAQTILAGSPNVVHVVPLTTTSRGFGSEVLIEPDLHNGLEDTSVAQCQHIRAVASARISRVRGNVGPSILAQIRESVGLILDIPD